MDGVKGTHSVIKKLAGAGSYCFLQAQMTREGNHVARNQRKGRMGEVFNRRCVLEKRGAATPGKRAQRMEGVGEASWPLYLSLISFLTSHGPVSLGGPWADGVVWGGPPGSERVGRGWRMEGHQSGIVLGIYKTRVCVRIPEILLSSHCGWKVSATAVGIQVHLTASPPGQRKMGTSCISGSYTRRDSPPEMPQSSAPCWVPGPCFSQPLVPVTDCPNGPRQSQSPSLWLVSTTGWHRVRDSWPHPAFPTDSSWRGSCPLLIF